MRKFRRSILGKGQEEPPEAVSVHLKSTSTVLDDLRGQATWDEEWMERHPGMVAASSHERKVQLLVDLLGQADGIRALREVLQASPALRTLMAEAGVVGQDLESLTESLGRVKDRLGEGAKFAGQPNETVSGAHTNGAKTPSRRNMIPQKFHQFRDTLRSLLSREENLVCADCTAKLPTWASINLGVFLCTQCAGCHRSLGVHISKVLSVQLDEWTDEQVDFMSGLGNKLANSFLEYHVPSSWQKPSHLEPRDYRESYIKAKYQDRLFEFRGRKNPVVKAPPAVDDSTMLVRELSIGASGSRNGRTLSQAMTEYIGFVNIVLIRGKHLVHSGMMGQQQQYMAALRIGTQEVRSRWVKSDGNPAWSEKLMLCWDGGMPLNIDVYGGKDHIGQAEVPLRKYLLKESDSAPAGDSRLIDPIAHAELGALLLNTPTPGLDQRTTEDRLSLRSRSSSSGNPPTLGSLSVSTSAATTPVLHVPMPRSRETRGNGGTIPAFSASGPQAAPPSGTDPIFTYGGSSVAANSTPSANTSGGGGGGNGRPPAGSADGKRVFVQPIPAAVRADSVDRWSSGNSAFDAPGGPKSALSHVYHSRGTSATSCGRIEELDNGDLYITLVDKTHDRYALESPMPGSVTPSPPPALDIFVKNFNSNGSNASISGSTSGKLNLKNLIRSMGSNNGGSASGAAGGGGGSSSNSARPAQGGLLIKIDFVRIEH
ncbi:unnamed protein product [Ascophyllum nodosum]